MMRERYGKSTKGWLFNRTLRYIETYLRDGDTVLIIGDVKFVKGENPEFYKGEHHLKITDIEESQVGSMYTGKNIGLWVAIVFLGIMMLMICAGGGIFIFIGGGMGLLMGKGLAQHPAPNQPNQPKAKPNDPPKEVAKPKLIDLASIFLPPIFLPPRSV